MRVWLGAAGGRYNDINVRCYINKPEKWDGFEYRDNFFLLSRELFEITKINLNLLQQYKPVLIEAEIKIEIF